MNNNQRINIDILYKDTSQRQRMVVNENDSVYQTIKNQYNCDNDILIVRYDQVCYFDETFSSFKNRISKDKDLFITVLSLKNIYNQVVLCKYGEITIELKPAYEKLQCLYRQQQEKIEELEKKLQETNQKLQELEIQQQKYQYSTISSDGVQTIFDSQIAYQQVNNRSISQLLKVITQQKKPLINPNAQLVESQLIFNKNCDSVVTSTIESCYFCNNSIDQQRIQLQCYHKYHEDCLVSLFLGQLQNQNAALSCLCQIEQKAPILQHIKDKDSQQILRHKLLQNQLNTIIQTNQLEKCQTKTCYFYFKRNPQLQIQKSFCPLCLII